MLVIPKGHFIPEMRKKMKTKKSCDISDATQQLNELLHISLKPLQDQYSPNLWSFSKFNGTGDLLSSVGDWGGINSLSYKAVVSKPLGLLQSTVSV